MIWIGIIYGAVTIGYMLFGKFKVNGRNVGLFHPFRIIGSLCWPMLIAISIFGIAVAICVAVFTLLTVGFYALPAGKLTVKSKSGKYRHVGRNVKPWDKATYTLTIGK